MKSDTHVLITGGTGLIGTRLTELLIEKGYTVAYLSREAGESGSVRRYHWDPMKGEVDERAFEGAEVIINLAGAGVADKPWSKKRKQLLLDSRVKAGEVLNAFLKEKKHQVHTLISASGADYYAFDETKETSDPVSLRGGTFLGYLSHRWEAAVRQSEEVDIRTVIFRIGLVLSDRGGAYPKMAAPIRKGLGAPLGSGNQAVSWIHIDDVCRMLIFAIENKNLSGTYNAVAPNPVSNRVLTETIAGVLNKKLWLPNVPGWVLRLFFGERADLLLKGRVVDSKKIRDAGFQFDFSEISEAVKTLVK